MSERDEMIELAELYALGGLDADERAKVESYLAASGCKEALAHGRLAAFALAATTAAQPPPELRERILADVRARARRSQPGAIPLQRSDEPLRRPWQRPVWMAVAAAAVVAIFAGTWALESRVFNRSWAASCAPKAAACSASGKVVAWGPQELRLIAHGLAALPPGKVYQAWYIRPGQAPVPAPTFSPDARGDASVAVPIGAERGLTIAVTVEPEGGSRAPTTAPFFLASID